MDLYTFVVDWQFHCDPGMVEWCCDGLPLFPRALFRKHMKKLQPCLSWDAACWTGWNGSWSLPRKHTLAPTAHFWLWCLSEPGWVWRQSWMAGVQSDNQDIRGWHKVSSHLMISCGLSHLIFTYILKKYFLLQSSQEIGFERFGSTLKAVEPAASNGGLTEVHACWLTLMETRGRLLPSSQVGSPCFCCSWAPGPYAKETKPSRARHPGLGHTRPHVGHRCAWPWWGGGRNVLAAR